MSDFKICKCPNCGKEFRVNNPEGNIHIHILAVVDCKCGKMLEYSKLTGELELV